MINEPQVEQLPEKRAMERFALGESLKAVLESRLLQVPLVFLLILPVVATAGQYWASGFYKESVRVEILFWPGARWHWAVPMNVAFVMGSMGLLYLGGIWSLWRQRTLAKAIFVAIGAAVAANLLGGAVNQVTGWHELQDLRSMELAGKANRAILTLWHNPIWEELVFRGLPLLGLWFVSKRWPEATRTGRWCYFLVPSIVFAVYHVPGHGYARITDTFILGLAFAWLALRYGFYSVIVLHCIFDAMMVPGLGTMKNFRPEEVRWLAEHAGLFNTVQSLALLSVAVLMLGLFAQYAWRSRRGPRMTNGQWQMANSKWQKPGTKGR